MQELRKKNVSLEDKLSTLERHLHEAKYEMEMQTLEYEKELHLVQDTVSDDMLYRRLNIKKQQQQPTQQPKSQQLNEQLQQQQQ